MATKDEVEAVADYLEEQAERWVSEFFSDWNDYNDLWSAGSREEVSTAYQAADLLRQFAALLT